MADTDVLAINAGSSSLEVSRRPADHPVTVERPGDAPTRPRPFGRNEHGARDAGRAGRGESSRTPRGAV
jgi:hypothetical protein